MLYISKRKIPASQIILRIVRMSGVVLPGEETSDTDGIVCEAAAHPATILVALTAGT